MCIIYKSTFGMSFLGGFVDPLSECPLLEVQVTVHVFAIASSPGLFSHTSCMCERNRPEDEANCTNRALETTMLILQICSKLLLLLLLLFLVHI